MAVAKFLTTCQAANRGGENRTFGDFIPPLLLFRGPQLIRTAIDTLESKVFVVLGRAIGVIFGLRLKIRGNAFLQLRFELITWRLPLTFCHLSTSTTARINAWNFRGQRTESGLSPALSRFNPILRTSLLRSVLGWSADDLRHR